MKKRSKAECIILLRDEKRRARVLEDILREPSIRVPSRMVPLSPGNKEKVRLHRNRRLYGRFGIERNGAYGLELVSSLSTDESVEEYCETESESREKGDSGNHTRQQVTKRIRLHGKRATEPKKIIDAIGVACNLAGSDTLCDLLSVWDAVDTRLLAYIARRSLVSITSSKFEYTMSKAKTSTASDESPLLHSYARKFLFCSFLFFSTPSPGFPAKKASESAGLIVLREAEKLLKEPAPSAACRSLLRFVFFEIPLESVRTYLRTSFGNTQLATQTLRFCSSKMPADIANLCFQGLLDYDHALFASLHRIVSSPSAPFEHTLFASLLHHKAYRRYIFNDWPSDPFLLQMECFCNRGDFSFYFANGRSPVSASGLPAPASHKSSSPASTYKASSPATSCNEKEGSSLLPLPHSACSAKHLRPPRDFLVYEFFTDSQFTEKTLRHSLYYAHRHGLHAPPFRIFLERHVSEIVSLAAAESSYQKTAYELLEALVSLSTSPDYRVKLWNMLRDGAPDALRAVVGSFGSKPSDSPDPTLYAILAHSLAGHDVSEQDYTHQYGGGMDTVERVPGTDSIRHSPQPSPCPVDATEGIRLEDAVAYVNTEWEPELLNFFLCVAVRRSVTVADDWSRSFFLSLFAKLLEDHSAQHRTVSHRAHLSPGDILVILGFAEECLHKVSVSQRENGPESAKNLVEKLLLLYDKLLGVRGNEEECAVFASLPGPLRFVYAGRNPRFRARYLKEIEERGFACYGQRAMPHRVSKAESEVKEGLASSTLYGSIAATDLERNFTIDDLSHYYELMSVEDPSFKSSIRSDSLPTPFKVLLKASLVEFLPSSTVSAIDSFPDLFDALSPLEALSFISRVAPDLFRYFAAESFPSLCHEIQCVVTRERLDNICSLSMLSFQPCSVAGCHYHLARKEDCDGKREATTILSHGEDQQCRFYFNDTDRHIDAVLRAIFSDRYLVCVIFRHITHILASSELSSANPSTVKDTGSAIKDTNSTVKDNGSFSLDSSKSGPSPLSSVPQSQRTRDDINSDERSGFRSTPRLQALLLAYFRCYGPLLTRDHTLELLRIVAPLVNSPGQQLSRLARAALQELPVSCPEIRAVLPDLVAAFHDSSLVPHFVSVLSSVVFRNYLCPVSLSLLLSFLFRASGIESSSAAAHTADRRQTSSSRSESVFDSVLEILGRLLLVITDIDLAKTAPYVFRTLFSFALRKPLTAASVVATAAVYAPYASEQDFLFFTGALCERTRRGKSFSLSAAEKESVSKYLGAMLVARNSPRINRAVAEAAVSSSEAPAAAVISVLSEFAEFEPWLPQAVAQMEAVYVSGNREERAAAERVFRQVLAREEKTSERAAAAASDLSKYKADTGGEIASSANGDSDGVSDGTECRKMKAAVSECLTQSDADSSAACGKSRSQEDGGEPPIVSHNTPLHDLVRRTKGFVCAAALFGDSSLRTSAIGLVSSLSVLYALRHDPHALVRKAATDRWHEVAEHTARALRSCYSDLLDLSGFAKKDSEAADGEKGRVPVAVAAASYHEIESHVLRMESVVAEMVAKHHSLASDYICRQKEGSAKVESESVLEIARACASCFSEVEYRGRRKAQEFVVVCCCRESKLESDALSFYKATGSNAVFWELAAGEMLYKVLVAETDKERLLEIVRNSRERATRGRVSHNQESSQGVEERISREAYAVYGDARFLAYVPLSSLKISEVSKRDRIEILITMPESEELELYLMSAPGEELEAYLRYTDNKTRKDCGNLGELFVRLFEDKRIAAESLMYFVRRCYLKYLKRVSVRNMARVGQLLYLLVAEDDGASFEAVTRLMARCCEKNQPLAQEMLQDTQLRFSVVGYLLRSFLIHSRRAEAGSALKRIRDCCRGSLGYFDVIIERILDTKVYS